MVSSEAFSSWRSTEHAVARKWTRVADVQCGHDPEHMVRNDTPSHLLDLEYFIAHTSSAAFSGIATRNDVLHAVTDLA